MTNRVEKINSLIRDEVGKIILHDFAFAPDVLVSLTKVDSSSNLIESKVYVSVYPEAKLGGILNALNKSVYDIQYKINRALRQRPVPKIKFIADKSEAKADRVEEILSELKKEEK